MALSAAILAAMTAPVLPGAEPWSHTGTGSVGALMIHGFTGNPSSMRIVAEALAAEGFHVELPRLPGHGTVVEEMVPTRWADWIGEVEKAYAKLAERADTIVVGGLSMGGTLSLRTAVNHPDIAGLILINPLTQPQAPEVVEMLDDFLQQGVEVMPAIGGDIADPDQVESSYDGAPIAALLSLIQDGAAPLEDQYGTLTMPLLLCSSPQDHVIEPAQGDYLAAQYGGDVERVILERSYHVATQDYDKDLIVERAVEFAKRVTSA